MSWLSDRVRDIGRALRSDTGKMAILGGIGGYGLFGKAAMNKFLTSSMLKNMASRYGTSYLTNTALGRPHAHKGALSSALWSLPFQAWKNYGLTQPLGEAGMEGAREGTDTPWWKLMLGQGVDDSPLGVGFQGPTRPTDPELSFMDMFKKSVPTYGEGEGEGIAKLLGIGSKGPVTGYKDKFDMLGLIPETMGFVGSDYTADEKWDQAQKRTKTSKEFMDDLMLNPYYKNTGYGWPGWNLPTAKNGGIMQKFQGGGDFIEDLVAQEGENPMETSLGSMLGMPGEGEQTLSTPEEMMMSEEGIPPEILEGIINQRDPLMQKIMEMIMNMIAPTMGGEEMPTMGPEGMGEMSDYLGAASEMGEEEMGDLGMYGGGDYTRGAHVMGPGGPKTDSINARLSDGEFVMTAKAVENAGGGDRMEGARKMYSMMNSLDPSSARPGEEPAIV